MAVAMLLPLSLGHFGLDWSPCAGSHSCPSGSLAVLGNFIFWGVCWKQPATALSLFDVFVS